MGHSGQHCSWRARVRLASAAPPCSRGVARGSHTRSRMRSHPPTHSHTLGPGRRQPGRGASPAGAGPHLWAQSAEQRRGAQSRAAPHRAPAPPPAFPTLPGGHRPLPGGPARRALLPGRCPGNQDAAAGATTASGVRLAWPSLGRPGLRAWEEPVGWPRVSRPQGPEMRLRRVGAGLSLQREAERRDAVALSPGRSVPSAAQLLYL